MRSFEEILKEFEEFFDMSTDKKNPGKSNSGKIKGRDINTSLEIEFMDAIRGISKNVHF
jgi:DnaJ-class molecular chaperone